jgi:hypothetical protein
MTVDSDGNVTFLNIARKLQNATTLNKLKAASFSLNCLLPISPLEACEIFDLAHDRQGA